jgi:hypothetical protein
MKITKEQMIRACLRDAGVRSPKRVNELLSRADVRAAVEAILANSIDTHRALLDVVKKAVRDTKT